MYSPRKTTTACSAYPGVQVDEMLHDRVSFLMSRLRVEGVTG